MVYEPRHEDITGASLTGIDGDTNRTYTLTHTGAVLAGMSIVAQGQTLTHGVGNDFTFSTLTNAITFLGVIPDFFVIAIDYEVSVTTSFTGSVNDEIRLMLVGENNSDVVPDDLINVSYSQAGTLQSSGDGDALKLYTCFLIASRWQSLGFVNRLEGVSFVKPDPKFFYDQYVSRLKKLCASSSSNIGFEKVSLNKDLGVDINTRIVRARRSDDVI